MFRINVSQRLLSLATVLTIASASPLTVSVARAQDASTVLQRAASKYAAATTLRIEFTQTLTNTLMGTTSVASGELLRKRPNLFSINFTKTSDRIVCDGKSIWLYLPSSAPDQVIKTPMQNMGSMVVDPLGQILTAPRDQYTVSSSGTATVGGHATHAIVLTPKRDDALFTKATVWVDDTDSTVRQIKTVESSGVERNIVVTNVTIDHSIPKTAFTFTPPANVRVISRSSALGG